MKFRYYNLIKLTLLIFLISCSPKVHKNIGVLDGIRIKPDYLSYHRDSVRFTIEGLIPISYLNPEVKITLFPEYRYHNQVITLPEISAFDGAYTLSSNQIRIQEDFKLPYIEGMESGHLLVKGIVQQKKKRYSAEKTLAEGIMTLPLLTRVGQIVMDEPIPKIGVYMVSDFSSEATEETLEFNIPFEYGKSELSASIWGNSELKKVLVEGIPGKSIKKIHLIGMGSPESLELNQNGIEERRVFAARGKVIELVDRNKTKLEISSRKRDWFEFRLLLSDYEGISPSEKEMIYQILTNQKPFEVQLREMQTLRFYSKMARDLFPKLRIAKVYLTLENVGFSDPEIAAKVYQSLNQEEMPAHINKDYLMFAGEIAVKLHEKEAIYTKLTEFFASEMAYNNLGVVYLNQAQRELDPVQREILISRAIQVFKQAIKIKPNSFAFHNLGQAYLLKKNYFEAYVAISEASSLERDENNSFLRFNEGLRGALDIINGDYKLATIRLNKAPMNEINLFNKGLAHFLSENYAMALESFEDAIQINREFGYGFYGLALIAAVSNDNQGVFENLEKAVDRSEYLRVRALTETVFKKYWENKEFREALK